MKLEKLRQPLQSHQIDFRVQSINKGQYVTILAYKNARVDMERLDDVCGALNWKREHTRDNHNCIVSIYDAEHNQWVGKEDTGTESNTEAEKGLASDSFKRACFNWGIGRELYDYPSISFRLNDDEAIKQDNGSIRSSYKFKLREWVWYSQHDTDGKLSFLACQDNNGQTRWKWGVRKKVTTEQEVVEAIDVHVSHLNNQADNNDDTGVNEVLEEVNEDEMPAVLKGVSTSTKATIERLQAEVTP